MANTVIMIPATNVADKRKHPRVRANLPTIYRSSNLTTDGYVANLSQGGAFIASVSVDEIGTAGELTVVLPGSDQVRLPGRVIWVHRWHPRPGMGITFVGLSRDQRLAIANFLIARLYGAD